MGISALRRSIHPSIERGNGRGIPALPRRGVLERGDGEREDAEREPPDLCLPGEAPPDHGVAEGLVFVLVPVGVAEVVVERPGAEAAEEDHVVQVLQRRGQRQALAEERVPVAGEEVLDDRAPVLIEICERSPSCSSWIWYLG